MKLVQGYKKHRVMILSSLLVLVAVMGSYQVVESQLAGWEWINSTENKGQKPLEEQVIQYQDEILRVFDAPELLLPSPGKQLDHQLMISGLATTLSLVIFV